MNMDIMYQTMLGRLLMQLVQKTGVLKIVAWFLRTKYSKLLIPHYIKKYHIDMTDFSDQNYDTFADFFARSKDTFKYVLNPDFLISPCDGMLSVYQIIEDIYIPMKGSEYRLKDLIPDDETARLFQNGLCMVFRLQATDYHHFCSFDDCSLLQTEFIPGQLHSVQPVACEAVPVYRLNRRWWSLLKTEHFGMVAQIEIGAMLVGGVTFAKEQGEFMRGEEMGHFELAGSTIVLILSEDVRRRFTFGKEYEKAVTGSNEIPVSMGEVIGLLRN